MRSVRSCDGTPHVAAGNALIPSGHARFAFARILMSDPRKQNRASILWRTELCEYAVRGRTCPSRRGACAFAHTVDELVEVSLEEKARRRLIPSATAYRWVEAEPVRPRAQLR